MAATAVPEREAIPPEHRWNAGSVFPTAADWDVAYNAVEEMLGEFAAFTAGYALSDRASCRGMAHSTDLRERIINAVIHKRYTLQKAADTFDVGAATVSRYLRRYRQTGDLTPRTSPGRPSALNEYQAWVEQSLISNDLTHDQRCDLLFDEIGVRISRATRCRWVQRLGSTRKKDDLRQ